MRKFKHVIWLTLTLLVLLLAGFIYATFFRPHYAIPENNTLKLLIFGSNAGAVIAFLIFKLILPSGSIGNPTNVSSHTVVESICKVFKLWLPKGS